MSARFAYVAVVEAETEPEARAYVDRNLHPGSPPCQFLGGGTRVSNLRRGAFDCSGPLAAAIAKDAYGLDGEGGELERLADALHAEAVK